MKTFASEMHGMASFWLLWHVAEYTRYLGDGRR
jgi:hypothetical protein